MVNIIWTEKAIADFSDSIYYLETQWSEKEINRFLEKTDEILDKLSKGNLTFQSTEHQNIYYVPILKQITLYYKITAKTTYLLRFWNNYQNPKTIKLN